MTNGMINELNLDTIRKSFATYGITMTDAEFSKLTIKEIRKYFKRAKKAYDIQSQVNQEIRAKFKKDIEIKKVGDK